MLKMEVSVKELEYIAQADGLRRTQRQTRGSILYSDSPENSLLTFDDDRIANSVASSTIL